MPVPNPVLARCEAVARRQGRIVTEVVFLQNGSLQYAVTALPPFRFRDGYKDDAEFLADVTCFDCGEGKDEARECDECGDTSCCVSRFDCAAGYDPDGLLLCPDCTPSHRGCPECDPADPRDR